MGAVQPVTLFLILRAFSSGTTALTGVECISNGVTAFKEPRSHNAGITMIWMSAILGVLFLGITFLLREIGGVPSETETVISQLARTVFNGRGLLYLSVISGTTIILVLATNTAFADFPRLAALQAGDGFLPRQLTFRGSRLVFSTGITALGVIASLLVFIFQASVTALVPLWAIGVFLSFTLSQTGMARRWWKIGHLAPGVEVRERGSTLHYEPSWKLKMVVNGFGAIVTAIVTIVFAATKFRQRCLDCYDAHSDAWLQFSFPFTAITEVWQQVYRWMRSSRVCNLKRHRVILPISGVNEGSLLALHYARLLSDDVTAVYICMNPVEAESVQKKWEVWGEGVRLVILDLPYRLLIRASARLYWRCY